MKKGFLLVDNPGPACAQPLAPIEADECPICLEALELTEANWDAEVVKSGKAAFIKFLAPW